MPTLPVSHPVTSLLQNTILMYHVHGYLGTRIYFVEVKSESISLFAYANQVIQVEWIHWFLKLLLHVRIEILCPPPGVTQTKAILHT